MLADFRVSRCSRKCYAQQRPLRPGEWYYSVVIETEAGDLERRDYSSEAWSEPPAGTVGWWKGQMPPEGKRKLVLAPNAVLIDLLRQLSGNDGQRELAYLLTLLLMRRRVIRQRESPTAAKETGSADAGPTEDAATPPTMTVEVISDGQTIEITECAIQAKDAGRLRDELNELLYCEAE